MRDFDLLAINPFDQQILRQKINVPLLVSLQAVKLTSSRTQLPYEYYSLPFCPPDKVVYKGENLGKQLSL